MKLYGDPKKRLAPFKNQRPDTLAIHGAQSPDPTTGALMPPIFQTSTYAQTDIGKPIGEYEYSRSQNPSRRTLEDLLALLEGGEFGLATPSGMSAVALILTLLQPGDEILCGDDVYGGTYRLLNAAAEFQGIKVRFTDLSRYPLDETVLDSQLTDKTKFVWLETPTNPLLKLTSIKKIADRLKSTSTQLVVDNTFMSPVFQKPLQLGADIVLHSMTKYIGGHSDVVAGSLILKDEELADRLYTQQNNTGQILAPFDSWMIVRSIKTLPTRMRAHQENAQALSRWLVEHPKVESVIYPGLETHPQHSLAKEQMSGFGGMISFYVKGGLDEARRCLQKTELFTLAESLGGVESLIEHPGIMTHASLPTEQREANGITDNFIRISVGLEDIEDLKTDLDQALSSK